MIAFSSKEYTIFIPQRIHHSFSRIALIALLAGLLGACNGFQGLSFPGVYRIDIPQGNIITQEMVDQLRPGLSKRQVSYIMGTPLIQDTFHQDRWDYVYSIKPGGERRMQERLTVFFEDGELVDFEGDFQQSEGNRQFGQDEAQDDSQELASSQDK